MWPETPQAFPSERTQSFPQVAPGQLITSSSFLHSDFLLHFSPWPWRFSLSSCLWDSDPKKQQSLFHAPHPTASSPWSVETSPFLPQGMFSRPGGKTAGKREGGEKVEAGQEGTERKILQWAFQEELPPYITIMETFLVFQLRREMSVSKE